MTKNSDYIKIINEATASLKEQLNWDDITQKPKIALVLGSGLGKFADALKDKRIVSFEDITHFPPSGVPGHAGRWVYGLTEDNIPLLVAQGRYHFYEGHDLKIITLPIRVMKELDIEHVVLTNAAGTANPDFHAGDFMLIDDHINFTGHSPLNGIADERLGPMFVDQSNIYIKSNNDALQTLCQEKHPDIPLCRGVYCCSMGPQYESAAEVKMFNRMGADALGMSTVPEALVARQAGIKINGITCLTNYGTGLSDQPLNHEEVSEMGKKRAPQFMVLVSELVKLL
jgi:purine-nucleoside phosphorylase